MAGDWARRAGVGQSGCAVNGLLLVTVAVVRPGTPPIDGQEEENRQKRGECYVDSDDAGDNVALRVGGHGSDEVSNEEQGKRQGNRVKPQSGEAKVPGFGPVVEAGQHQGNIGYMDTEKEECFHSSVFSLPDTIWVSTVDS